MATRPARKSRPARKPKPAAKTTGRKRADEATIQERRDEVQARMVDGNESAATVAKDLGITAGKAAFIAMQLRVENGEVPKISWKDDAQLIAKTAAARNKADEFSSWGWLAARTNVGEATLKNKVEQGGHEVSGTRIASVRKAKNGNGNGKKAPAKTTAKKSTRTRTRRSQADPS